MPSRGETYNVWPTERKTGLRKISFNVLTNRARLVAPKNPDVKLDGRINVLRETKNNINWLVHVEFSSHFVI